MYIKDDVLKWSISIQFWSDLSNEEVFRAEDLLRRAENHLSLDVKKDSRADCLLTLKRSLNHRLKLIEEVHKFKKMKIFKSPKGYLELLEVLGVVRPLLLKKLLKVRNEIEHEDINPPSLNQCRELIDVVWYFLKSTNRLVSMKSDDFLLNKLGKMGVETQYWLNFEIQDQVLEKIHITGWVPKSYIRKSTVKPDYILVDIQEIGSKEERWPNSGAHSDKLITDVWVNGLLFLNEKQRLYFIKRALAL